MNVSFDESFLKSLKKVKDKSVLSKVEEIIYALEAAELLGEIPNCKKLVGYKTYYRIRIGNYRLGLEFEQQEVQLITILHRKDIYRKFP